MELPRFRRQLSVLEYPGLAGFDVFSVGSVKELVVWLEERFFGSTLSDEQKQSLRAQAGDEWVAGPCHELLERLGSPFSFGRVLSDVQRATVVEWLLNTALAMTYEARADELDAGASHEPASHEDALAQALREGVERNGAGESLRAVAQRLAQELGLPPANTEEEARALVLACLRHAARLWRRGGERQSAAAEAAFVELRPDRGASDLLRVLYCEDAAQLERRSAALLVLLQNLTAAPVVDSALGKGGR